MHMYDRREQSEFLPLLNIPEDPDPGQFVRLLTSDTVNEQILHFQMNSLSQEPQQALQG